MLTRRFFLKSSGLALVVVRRRAPALVRSAYAAGRARPAEDAGGRLPARRLRRAQHRGPLRRRALPPAAADHRHPAPRAAAAATPRSTSTATSACTPRSSRCCRSGSDGSLAVVHAVGSPDSTRSHFDAQDFMESGTPGIKSTDDGWMNRAPAGAARTRRRRPSARVALTPTLPRSLAGPRARGRDGEHPRASACAPAGGGSGARLRGHVRRARCSDVLHGTGRETFEAIDVPEEGRPGALPARRRAPCIRAAATATA